MNKNVYPIIVILLVLIWTINGLAQNNPTITQKLAASQKFNFFSLPNQSASYIGMQARGSSVDVSATYYNPAGLVYLKNNGLHIGLNNQSIRQNTSISGNYQYYNETDKTFDGLVSAPVFPSFFVAYKKNKFALSMGISPIAGGGGGAFDNLPTVERNISDIIPNLQAIFALPTTQLFLGQCTLDYNSISDYRVDFRSAGSAYYIGSQIGLSYALHPKVAFSIGTRYVYAQVKAEGHTRNIEIFPDAYGAWLSPGNYMRYIAQECNASILDVSASILDFSAGNRDINIEQKGAGFTPIIGLHIQPVEKLNIGLKYEHKTAIELTTAVIDGKDGSSNGLHFDPLFIDGTATRSDLPATISGGVDYLVLPKLTLAAGARYLFNKQTNYDGREAAIDKNTYEINAGLLYSLNDDITLSVGYGFSNWTLNASYQTDVDFWMDVHSMALGAQYSLSPTVQVNMGLMTSLFNQIKYDFVHTPVPPNSVKDYLGAILPDDIDPVIASIVENMLDTT